MKMNIEQNVNLEISLRAATIEKMTLFLMQAYKDGRNVVSFEYEGNEAYSFSTFREYIMCARRIANRKILGRITLENCFEVKKVKLKQKFLVTINYAYQKTERGNKNGNN